MSNAAIRDQATPAAVLGVCLLLGLVLGGWVLGAEVKAMKQADRFVTVKGLVERTVQSDRGSWTLTLQEAGDDLPTAYRKSANDKAAVVTFLQQRGFHPEEISTGQVSVADRQTTEDGSGAHRPRFTVSQAVTVVTHDVNRLAQAGQHTDQLVEQGIVVAAGSGGGIQYEFTGLNALKPDMITEATKNARASADRFAADSGAKVGSIRSANQGSFSISAPDSAAAALNPDMPDYSGQNTEASSITKKVRVVATIDYYLTN